MEYQQQSSPIEISKKKSKKGCWIVVIILLVIALCCAAPMIIFGGTFLVGFKALSEETDSLQVIMKDACEDKGSINNIDDYFTDTYTAIDEVEYALEMAFPDAFDCESLMTDGFINLILSGHTVMVEVSAGQSTAQYTFNNGERNVTIEFDKTGDDWKIENVKSGIVNK